MLRFFFFTFPPFFFLSHPCEEYFGRKDLLSQIYPKRKKCEKLADISESKAECPCQMGDMKNSNRSSNIYI